MESSRKPVPSAAARAAALVAGVLLLLPGCATSPQEPEAAPAAAAEPQAAAQAPEQFSGQRAFEHLKALVEIGPRVTGSEGGERARALLKEALSAQGLEPQEWPSDIRSPKGTLRLVNLTADVPGASSDLLLVATPYDSAPVAGVVGANEGASGAAVLLELARVLARDPLPYTVRLAFLDGELASPQEPWMGSQMLAVRMGSDGSLARVRMLLYLHQVGDRDLGISRDLRSQRVFRRHFFRAAKRLGLADRFPGDALFDDVPGGHRAFEAAGFRRFVALVDPRFGEGDPPGSEWRTPEDDLAHCSADSLEAVGRVTVAGLRDVAALLSKIDRFARPGEPPAEPTAEPSPDDSRPEPAAQGSPAPAEAPRQAEGGA